MGLMYEVFVRSVLSKLKYFMWTYIHTYGKGKVHPKTGHEGPEGEYRYKSTLSLTSALDGGWWSMPRPSCFTPPVKKKTGTHCTGSLVGPKDGQDGCRKPHPHWDSIPRLSSP